MSHFGEASRCIRDDIIWFGVSSHYTLANIHLSLVGLWNIILFYEKKYGFNSGLKIIFTKWKSKYINLIFFSFGFSRIGILNRKIERFEIRRKQKKDLQ